MKVNEFSINKKNEALHCCDNVNKNKLLVHKVVVRDFFSLVHSKGIYPIRSGLGKAIIRFKAVYSSMYDSFHLHRNVFLQGT